MTVQMGCQAKPSLLPQLRDHRRSGMFVLCGTYQSSAPLVAESNNLTFSLVTAVRLSLQVAQDAVVSAIDIW